MTSFPYISIKHTESIISLPEAKEWIRMDIDGYIAEDGAIQAAVAGAIQRVESRCNLSLGLSTYTWNTTGLPCDFRDAKYVKEIVSVRIDGNLVPTEKYKLVRTGEVYSAIRWYGVSPGRETEIVFLAGFGTRNVPEDLMLAIRAMVGSLVDNRGDSVSERKTLSDKLMANYEHGYAG